MTGHINSHLSNNTEKIHSTATSRPYTSPLAQGKLNQTYRNPKKKVLNYMLDFDPSISQIKYGAGRRLGEWFLELSYIFCILNISFSIH